MVSTLRYKEGWKVRLFGGQPPFTGTEQLNINFECTATDNRDRKTPYTSAHLFIVPRKSRTKQEWMFWLFEQCQKVDLHEAMELFEVEGYRPFWPDHVNSNSYVLAERDAS
jgi:hypothetical protein